jgi:hypothetical protein
MALKRYIASWSMLLLFVVYQIGAVSFPHVHIINGVAIFHSHFSSDDNHEHTAKQVDSLDCICQFVCSDVPTLVSFVPLVRSEVVVRYAEPLFAEHKGSVNHFNKRGPPSIC